MKEIIKKLKHVRRFFKFIGRKKISRLNFLLVVFILIFLPPEGYYSEVRAVWEGPKVFAAHFVIPPPTPLPKNVKNIPAPFMTARSVIVVDVPSAFVLYKKDASLPLPMASTTKIMTAYVSLDYYHPDWIVEVPHIYSEGQSIKLQKGEKLTIESLLYGLLVASANDVAEVLAANYPGGRSSFILKMNEKAKKLHLWSTNFVNPTGIDESEQYTSSVDLARLTKDAILDPLFSKIVATKDVTIFSVDKKYVHPMSNINTLLGKVLGVRGVKTGYTEVAGECLVALVERDNRQIITVILGSQDRFGETEQLVNWVFENFRWNLPV